MSEVEEVCKRLTTAMGSYLGSVSATGGGFTKEDDPLLPVRKSDVSFILSRLAGGPADAEEKPSTPTLEQRLRESVEAFKAMPPEEQQAMIERQRDGYVKAEMSWGDEGTRLAASPSPPPPAGEDMSVEPSQQFADPGKMVGSHASYTTPPPAAGWTEEQIKAAAKAIKARVPIDYGMTEAEAEDYARACLATLAPPPSGWQPIESAPKDGTPILVARHVETFGWVRGWAAWEEARGIGGWIAREFFSVPGVLGLAHPTHWQPLPPPPSGRE